MHPELMRQMVSMEYGARLDRVARHAQQHRTTDESDVTTQAPGAVHRTRTRRLIRVLAFAPLRHRHAGAAAC